VCVCVCACVHVHARVCVTGSRDPQHALDRLVSGCTLVCDRLTRPPVA